MTKIQVNLCCLIPASLGIGTKFTCISVTPNYWHYSIIGTNVFKYWHKITYSVSIIYSVHVNSGGVKSSRNSLSNCRIVLKMCFIWQTKTSNSVVDASERISGKTRCQEKDTEVHSPQQLYCRITCPRVRNSEEIRICVLVMLLIARKGVKSRRHKATKF